MQIKEHLGTCSQVIEADTLKNIRKLDLVEFLLTFSKQYPEIKWKKIYFALSFISPVSVSFDGFLTMKNSKHKIQKSVFNWKSQLSTSSLLRTKDLFA